LNNNAGGAATNGDNFGDAGGESYNSGYGDDAGGDGTCRRCGQGTYIIIPYQRLGLANSASEGHFANDCDQVRRDFAQVSIEYADKSQPRQMGACFNCVSCSNALPLGNS
jgi:hypothetical protein